MYKQCSHCGAYTDEDEKKCPNCGRNPFGKGVITLPQLLSKLEKGAIAPKKIWTKNPEIIYNAAGGSL